MTAVERAELQAAVERVRKTLAVLARMSSAGTDSDRELAADLRTLIAAAEAGARDAERYRFVRDGLLSPRDVFDTTWLMERGALNDLDAAVDAAIASHTAIGEK
jgi:hypothetical protein